MYKPKKDEILKINLGSPESGFIVSRWDKLKDFPDNSVTLLSAAHVLEKIPRDKFIGFMNEAWRVLKHEGQFRIAVYYGGSTPFWADPMNVNGLTTQSWSFFDPLSMGGVLYHRYKPKPWKIEACYVQIECTIEVLLSKRRLAKKYVN